eukprot:COSAG04_NODE_399_length_14959_cov_28.238730_7_plen_226_part_00
MMSDEMTIEELKQENQSLKEQAKTYQHHIEKLKSRQSDLTPEESETLAFVRRIQSSNVTCVDYMAQIDRYKLIGMLCPKMDQKVIKHARSNHSKLREGLLTWHMVEMLPRLFLAGLGAHTVDRHEDYRFRMRSLKHLLKDWMEERDELETQLEEARDDSGYMTKDEIKDMKQEHRQEVRTLKEQIQTQAQHIKWLEEKQESAAKRSTKQTQYYEEQLRKMALESQ